MKSMGKDLKISRIEIPYELVLYEDEDGFAVSSSYENGIQHHHAAVGYGKTLEDAIKDFKEVSKVHEQYEINNRRYSNKWILWKKGPWSVQGGRWFQILGIRVYFRYGKNMKYGWYIPLTKLNISIYNHWRKRKEKQ